MVLDYTKATTIDRMAKPNPSAPAADESIKPSTSNGETTSETTSGTPSDDSVYGLAWVSICGYLAYRIIYYSYKIRMSAIDEYGPVIHEFDPYFNYRATEVRKQKRSRIKEKEQTILCFTYIDLFTCSLDFS